MKKILLTGFLCFVLTGCYAVYAEQSDLTQNKTDYGIGAGAVKEAIKSYKSGDFLACISSLKEYTNKNPDNAVAWYYLGNAYMNIAMTNEANAAFDKVIELNSVPKLTSYSIQAQLCMKNSKDCKYENFSLSDIAKLKENPVKFITDYYEALNQKSIKSDDVIQIENLIKGSYTDNVHPQAQDFILNERAKIKASQINSGKS